MRILESVGRGLAEGAIVTVTVDPLQLTEAERPIVGIQHADASLRGTRGSFTNSVSVTFQQAASADLNDGSVAHSKIAAADVQNNNILDTTISTTKRSGVTRFDYSHTLAANARPVEVMAHGLGRPPLFSMRSDTPDVAVFAGAVTTTNIDLSLVNLNANWESEHASVFEWRESRPPLAT